MELNLLMTLALVSLVIVAILMFRQAYKQPEHRLSYILTGMMFTLLAINPLETIFSWEIAELRIWTNLMAVIIAFGFLFTRLDSKNRTKENL
jgi:hypothetical protein